MFSLPRNEKEKLDTPPLTRAPGSVLCVDKENMHLITNYCQLTSHKKKSVNDWKLEIYNGIIMCSNKRLFIFVT